MSTSASSWAYTPKVDSYKVDGTEFLTDGKARHLVDLDLTYRYIPLAEASYRSLVWGTEVLYNRESFERRHRHRSGRSAARTPSASTATPSRASPAASIRASFPVGAADQPPGRRHLAYSPYLTLWASEFQRLRAQYQYLSAPGDHESQFFLQWTAIIGSHVHGFRDR